MPPRLALGFTRRETLELSQATSNRLQYLERADLIKPTRTEASTRPTVIYSWEQILEIYAIKSLKKSLSIAAFKNVIELLNETGFDNSLVDKQIVVIDEVAFWVRIDWADFCEQIPYPLKSTMQTSLEIQTYNMVVIPHLSKVVREIWKIARHSSSIDFESFKQRAKARPTS